MVDRPNRRRVIQYCGTALGFGFAGCLGDSGTGPSPSGPEDSTETAAPPSERTSQYPDVDERVDELPPGAPVLSPGGEWPSFRFDAGNTGANPAGEGLRNGTDYWRLNAGGGATMADGTLYNIFSRGREQKELTVRDPATASVRTRAPLVGYGVTGPPVVGDGRILVNTFIEVFCFDAESGDQLWRGPAMDGIQGRPTVDDGTVFVNSGGFDGVAPHLRAFDAATGRELWRYDVGAETKSTPAVGRDLVFVTGSGGVSAVDRASGDEAFVLPEVSTRWGSPVVDDGVLYAGDESDETRELVALDTESRTERWRQTVETDSPPVTDGDVVYARTPDGVAALHRADGSVLVSSSRKTRPLGLVGDVLYAAANGTLWALDAAGELEPLWSLQTDQVQISDTVGRAIYDVTPVDGAVYVSARDAFYGVGPADPS